MTTCVGLDQLVQFVNEVEAMEGDAEVVLTSAALVSGVLSCRLAIHGSNAVVAEWVAEFVGVVENELSIGSSFWPQLVDAHALLADYEDHRADLYFSGPVDNVESAVASLHDAHRRTMGEWRPISRYLNPNVGLDALMSSPSGVLASGPRGLIEEFDRALAGQTTTRVIVGGPPLRWNSADCRFDPYPKLLLVVGAEREGRSPAEPSRRALVIAESVAFGRVG